MTMGQEALIGVDGGPTPGWCVTNVVATRVLAWGTADSVLDLRLNLRPFLQTYRVRGVAIEQPIHRAQGKYVKAGGAPNWVTYGLLLCLTADFDLELKEVNPATAARVASGGIVSATKADMKRGIESEFESLPHWLGPATTDARQKRELKQHAYDAVAVVLGARAKGVF